MSATKHVLLVEGQPNEMASAIEAIQEQHLDHMVSVARNGDEALDYLYCRGRFSDRPQGLPAALVLDLKMPRQNGAEFLWKVKSDWRLRRIPVVMFTSSRQASDVAQSYDFGASAYVVKPREKRQFAEAVRQVVVFWAGLNELPPEDGNE